MAGGGKRFGKLQEGKGKVRSLGLRAVSVSGAYQRRSVVAALRTLSYCAVPGKGSHNISKFAKTPPG